MRVLAGALAVVLAAALAWGAPKADLWPRWQAHDGASTEKVDHDDWAGFLDNYLDTAHPSGIFRVRYHEVTKEDKAKLDRYVSTLGAVRVSTLNRPEQEAYWINLYNALTVRVVLDHYPVDSIRDIRSGFFTAGPWELALVEVEGENLTLNDIEHRILRPIWRDPRVHYAVNCASLGCPNLAAVPYTAENLDVLLDESAKGYINHPRGVTLREGRLVLSSIYDWYGGDFGEGTRGIVEHLRRYARPVLADALEGFSGGVSYDYDWSLNE